MALFDNNRDYVGYIADPKTVIELTNCVSNILQQVQDRFQAGSEKIMSRIGDMGHKIDELERNVADLMTQAGVSE